MDKLQKIKIEFILDQPFFGYLIMHIPFKRDDSIESIGTDGERIYYNVEFVNEASENEIKFLIMHQVLHLILNHVVRSYGYGDEKTFSKAADLVVNSIALESLQHEQINSKNINVDSTIDGRKASDMTVDQVYSLLIKTKKDGKSSENESEPIFDDCTMQSHNNASKNSCDDHSMWKNLRNKSKHELGQMANKWALYVKEATDFASNKNGTMSLALKRVIKYMERNKVDWKSQLRNFVESEITDYSFNPPDKRYLEYDCMMPDFNETDDKVAGVFFFIDVSGSMSNEQVAECKAELRACINQYNGKVEGYLGYFDYEVSNLKSFDDEESMENIESLGGGGTSFKNIFKYLEENEFDVEKKKVIIMTDGYAEFPDESSLNVDEVLWIINNEEVTPPFGEVVRIQEDTYE